MVWKRSRILVVVFDEPAKYYNELLLITLTIIADAKCVFLSSPHRLSFSLSLNRQLGPVLLLCASTPPAALQTAKTAAAVDGGMRERES